MISRNLTELVSNMVEIDEKETWNSSTLKLSLWVFTERVKRLFPDCKFGYVGNENPYTDRCYVYHPNKSYVMGWIGYGRFFRNNKEEDTYTVFSRLIRNEKYSHGNEHYMKMSRNIEVAVRNAKKFLCDWAIGEVASQSYVNIRNKWYGTDKALQDSFEHSFRKLQRGSISAALVEELVKLTHSQHVFNDSDLREAVAEVVKTYDERQEAAKERSSSMVTVSVEPHYRTGENQYLVADLGDISQYVGAEYSDSNRYPTTTYTEQELPENIMRPLSVLAMCEPDQWVDNVGYKLDNRVYHVVT